MFGSSRSPALLAVVALGIGAACNELTGSVDLAAGSGPDGGPATADGAPPIVIDPPKGCPSAGRRCVAAPPPGWEGPLLLFAGAPGEVPACPSSMALTRVSANGGEPKGGHSCAACTCEPATGIACTANLRHFDLDECSSASNAGLVTLGQCVPLAEDAESFRLILVAAGGACASSADKPLLDPVVWAEALRGCGAPTLLADGCGPNELCTPEAPAPFLGRSCVTTSGDTACPAGWPDRHGGFVGVDDTRACTGCACGPVIGATCSATLAHYNSGACAGDPRVTITNPEACHAGEEGEGIKLVTGPTGAGSCAASGTPSATGKVAAKDPITVCCRP